MRQRGITLEMLGNELGITKQAVRLFITSSNPKLETMRRVAEVLKVPVWQLFIDPKDITRCEGPSFEVECPHCGASLDVVVPVSVK